MKDGWSQSPPNKKVFRFYNSQPNSNKTSIVCIDEIVKKGQEIHFIIKEKETLKVYEAVHLWRKLKLKC